MNIFRHLCFEPSMKLWHSLTRTNLLGGSPPHFLKNLVTLLLYMGERLKIPSLSLVVISFNLSLNLEIFSSCLKGVYSTNGKISTMQRQIHLVKGLRHPKINLLSRKNSIV